MVTADHLDAFIVKLNNMLNDEKVVISYTIGKRYARIVRTVYGNQRSAYGFIDTTNGDLLKADGWRKPALGKRGSIFADNPLDGCGQYGMVYKYR